MLQGMKATSSGSQLQSCMVKGYMDLIPQRMPGNSDKKEQSEQPVLRVKKKRLGSLWLVRSEEEKDAKLHGQGPDHKRTF